MKSSEKKMWIISAAVLVCAAALAVCLILQNKPTVIGAGKSGDVKIDYGESAVYTKKDMDSAIDIILKEFKNFKGCTLYNIRYAADECNSAENIKWMNELSKGQKLNIKFTQCISFLSDFHTGSESEISGTFNPDADYNNWSWYLARKDDGKWYLLTWGF